MVPRRRAIDSPLVRGFYDLSFAYEDGDQDRPRFPAGLALHLALRMFLDYKGALFWKMRAGMGDVVFAPLYQALRRRGVRFRFFHRLDNLHLSDDRRTVEAATFGREDVAADEYAPLVRIRGLPVFPTRPDSLRPDAASVRLEAGRDYDALVLAVSLGMLPYTCTELIESDERWRSMVDRVGTVATQAFQVWMSADERALGWDQPAATVTGCGEPFETFASMSHTLPLEDWPEDERPLTAAYFCGALAESEIAGGPAPSERVQAAAAQFLERRGPALWPAAADANGDLRAELVHAQYWRANVDPSDRYVQSLPGRAATGCRPTAAGSRTSSSPGTGSTAGSTRVASRRRCSAACRRRTRSRAARSPMAHPAGTSRGRRCTVADRDPAPDPLAGLRAMAEVQRAGLEAASTVVERMLELGRLGTRGPFPFPLPADPTARSNGEGRSDDDPERDVRRLRGDAERMLELWGEWMRLLVDAAADSAEVALGPPSRGGADHLSLGPAKAGASVSGRTWLHVLDGPPTAPARLTATALTAADGSTIDPGTIAFEPAVLDTFDLRSSQEIVVTVDLPVGTAPGPYHGHILATGLPELSLPVRLEVSA